MHRRTHLCCRHHTPRGPRSHHHRTPVVRHTHTHAGIAFDELTKTTARIKHITEEGVGAAVGARVGGVGDCVGAAVGVTLGAAVGVTVGVVVGEALGETEGAAQLWALRLGLWLVRRLVRWAQRSGQSRD